MSNLKNKQKNILLAIGAILIIVLFALIIRFIPLEKYFRSLSPIGTPKPFQLLLDEEQKQNLIDQMTTSSSTAKLNKEQAAQINQSTSASGSSKNTLSKEELEKIIKESSAK